MEVPLICTSMTLSLFAAGRLATPQGSCCVCVLCNARVNRTGTVHWSCHGNRSGLRSSSLRGSLQRLSSKRSLSCLADWVILDDAASAMPSATRGRVQPARATTAARELRRRLQRRRPVPCAGRSAGPASSAGAGARLVAAAVAERVRVYHPERLRLPRMRGPAARQRHPGQTSALQMLPRTTLSTGHRLPRHVMYLISAIEDGHFHPAVNAHFT